MCGTALRAVYLTDTCLGLGHERADSGSSPPYQGGVSGRLWGEVRTVGIEAASAPCKMREQASGEVGCTVGSSISGVGRTLASPCP